MGSPRLGCLYIPDFRIQVHRRIEGLSTDRPLVLLEPRGRRQVVSAVSAGADAAGIRPGMSHTQAEHACPDALFRAEVSSHGMEVSQSLLERLRSLTPLVEAARLGLYYLGMEGLRWLHRDEAALLKAALREAQLEGLEATAGAAGTRFCAFTAARVASPGQAYQVPPGQDRSFLAPLPMVCLPAEKELLERLKLVGLETLGELAQLSPRAIERRYGGPGVELLRLARAEDATHIEPTRPELERCRTLLLEDPVEQAEGLLFLLSPLLEHLIAELSSEGRACAALSLSLRLVGAELIEVPVLLGAPVTSARPLVELLRLKLQALELPAGVMEARLEATRVTEPSTPQGDLFRRVGSPAGMAMTLARLSEALGEDAVVISARADAYRPDQAYVMQPAQKHVAELTELVSGGGKRGVKGSSDPQKLPPGGSEEKKPWRTRGKSSVRGNRGDPSPGPGAAAGAGAAAGGSTRTVPVTATGTAAGPRAVTGAVTGAVTSAVAEQGVRPGGEGSELAPEEWRSGAAVSAGVELPGGLKTGVGFRREVPARALRVQCDEEGPMALQTGGRRRQVMQRQGPFRYEGLWWEKGYGRDYYQLQLNDGAELLIYRELEGGKWYLEGVYD